jgi:hypothetical protein
MSLDVKHLKQRQRELFGQSREIDDINIRDELPICHKLLMEGKKINAQFILLEKAKLMTRELRNNDPQKMLLQLVIQIYEKQINSNCETNTR